MTEDTQKRILKATHQQMPAIMEKWEMHLPQQAEGEVRAETDQSTTEGVPMRERQEAALNPRISTLREARDEAERNLQEAILDLETREQSPAFQKAKELYDAGMRMEYNEAYEMPKLVYGTAEQLDVYGLDDAADKECQFLLKKALPDTSKASMAGGAEDMARLFQAMGVSGTERTAEVAYHLLNMTRETRPTSQIY